MVAPERNTLLFAGSTHIKHPVSPRSRDSLGQMRHLGLGCISPLSSHTFCVALQFINILIRRGQETREGWRGRERGGREIVHVPISVVWASPETSKESSCVCLPSCCRDTGITDVNCCIWLYLGSRDCMVSALPSEPSLQSHMTGFLTPGKSTI